MASEENLVQIIDAFSHHLTNNGPIAETLLKYLNAKQLNSCATVCKIWSQIVRRLKSKRRTRSWTYSSLPYGADDITPVVEDTKQFLQNLYTEPDVVFMMCETDLLSTNVETPRYTTSGRRSHSTSMNYEKFVRSLLPNSCKLIGVGAGGIVGTSADCKESHEVESSRSVGVSFLCLPKYEGVDISLCEDIEYADDDVKMSQFYNSLSQQSSQVCKVVLMMMSDFNAPRKHGTKLMKALAGSLVAGAYVDEIIPIKQEEYSFVRLASISGENVQVASVIIHETIKNANDAEECVKRLKAQNLPEENSFGLMFACLGRGEGLYGQSDVESSLFRKYFPKIPLIGLFGNGEIGFEMENKGIPQLQEPEVKKIKAPLKLYHSYTTVLVLISLS